MLDALSDWILTILILLPLVGAVVTGLLRPNGGGAERVGRVALFFSVLTLVATVLMVVMFYGAAGGSAAGQGETALQLNLNWVSDAPLTAEGPAIGRYIDLRYHVGVDGLSLWLIVLSALLTPLCIWGSFTAIRERVVEYYALLLLLEAGVIGVFCARDLLLFYVFFEFTLLPLFFLIGIWGGPQRRYAAAKFFLYTFTGSMLTFAGVLFLAWQAYSLPRDLGGVGYFTFDLETLYRLQLPVNVQWWLFLAMAAGFAVKVPLFPLHTWLPLAHTEAPTAGSVLLAGVLLKLGTYGFLRLSLPMLPEASVAFAPLMGVLAIIGIIYAALAAWVQGDVKKLVAYSSVSHLGFCVLGMFSLKIAGLTGSLLYMVNHGLSTGALFLVVGMVYERYHTREFAKLGGLAKRMPWLAFFLVFFTLTSIGLPGLNGFVSEFLVLVGTFTSAQADAGGAAGPLGVTYAVFAASGIILSAVYMLAMVGRLLFGPLNEPPHTPDTSRGLTPDLTGREIGLLVPIAVACVLLGVWPRPLIDTIQPAAGAQVLAHMRSDHRHLPADVVLGEETGVRRQETGGEGDRLQVTGDSEGTGSAVRVAVPVPVPLREADRLQVAGDSGEDKESGDRRQETGGGGDRLQVAGDSGEDKETGDRSQEAGGGGDRLRVTGDREGTGSAVRVAVPVPVPLRSHETGGTEGDMMTGDASGRVSILHSPFSIRNCTGGAP